MTLQGQHLMAHKSNAFPLLKAFVPFVKQQVTAHVKIIRTDNAMEFKEASALEFYKCKGILHQTFLWIPLNKMG